MLDLYLIRHAQSEANVKPIVGGRNLSVPLTPHGRYQAEMLGHKLTLDGVVFDEIYSSPAVRTMQTAEIVCKDMGIERIEQYDDLVEISRGDWEGLPHYDVFTPETKAQMNREHWDFKAPNGESQREVEERMHGWADKYLLPRHEQNLTVGIFSHGRAIGCFLRGAMEFSPRMIWKVVIDNTSVCRLRYDHYGWRTVKINDTSHIPDQKSLLR